MRWPPACLVHHVGAGGGHIRVQPRSHSRQDGGAQRGRIRHLQARQHPRAATFSRSPERGVAGAGSCGCRSVLSAAAAHILSRPAAPSPPAEAAPPSAGGQQQRPTFVRMKGTLDTSAWICIHSGERVAPPATVTEAGAYPLARIVSKMCSVPKQMLSSSARKTWPRPWASVRPVMAPRLTASVCGVRLPCWCAWARVGAGAGARLPAHERLACRLPGYQPTLLCTQQPPAAKQQPCSWQLERWARPPHHTHTHTHLEVVQAHHPLAARRHRLRLAVQRLVALLAHQAPVPGHGAAGAGLAALHLRSAAGTVADRLAAGQVGRSGEARRQVGAAMRGGRQPGGASSGSGGGQLRTTCTPGRSASGYTPHMPLPWNLQAAAGTQRHLSATSPASIHPSCRASAAGQAANQQPASLPPAYTWSVTPRCRWLLPVSSASWPGRITPSPI